MRAYLQLENGMIFEGTAFGKIQEISGEVVFNTGMTGYQELMTDPSYYGQIVTMTYPLIGNYGINLEDFESDGPKIRALIVRERSKSPSNFRCEMDLDSYLKYSGVTGLEGIDTRALTKTIREKGTMKGVITTRMLTATELRKKLGAYDNSKAVYKVTTKESYIVEGTGKHVAVMDFGIKNNIIESFKEKNCKVTVFPATASWEEVLGVNPDGVFLSNGPGDPKDYMDIIENVKVLVDKKPTIGICLGHQLIALALGGETKKLKFGHRGCNHPVKDIKQDRVYITSQNHGYVVTKVPESMEVTHVSMNDESIEGLRHKDKPVMSVQFHPEASPGPSDSDYIFEHFIEVLEEVGHNA
ncbi:carbamoyl phosphate synthase small subunit [Alkalibacter saccharofermentans]|uniref:Carbamoyl phosphate synthase small chain n=1 Tax=Alkalibacter saccharofermentans DSM 14828 TaxID=1120975 RepID=A0A1M4TL41_9FIRM|nr:carbamoyl phosphate synthase small subunit [Alkalibacter saccharofermentans]SHE45148.1 carbamoyl-phosphate synthase small subunit [Alkalibacter saccharofermentans DSM 14828]